ncbi:hypothetical protein UlMin_016427 [Ulmus minor]
MGKRGKSQTKGDKNPKRKFHGEDNFVDEDMDDEIDAFHKQRDKVTFDVNEGAEESDEDDEVPVFDFEDGNDSEDDDDDDNQDTGLAAKIVKQQKFLRAKFGGVEDEMDDEEEEEDQKEKWHGNYYGGDNNVDVKLQSSDDEAPAEEEAEVIRLQRENAKSMSMEDFGLEDTSEDDSDRELTLEEMSAKGKDTRKSSLKKEVADDVDTAYEAVKKDLNALSKEELMDVLFSSAPELVGLLSEFNDAIGHLESKVDPLLNKVKNGELILEGGIRYLELKKFLLLSYCQAIVFYLLLKSEGLSVRDHPVLGRLVEIRSLLDKMKQLDENLPSELEEILDKSNMMKTVVKSIKENVTSASDSFAKNHEPFHVSAETQEVAEPSKSADLVKVESLNDPEKKAVKRKRQDEQVGVQSKEMLKVRAALEEKLKQKGVLSSFTPKTDKAHRHLKPLNGQLETYDDFDDDAANLELTNGHASSLSSRKLSKLVAKPKKLKVISGDDDLPKRDDIGERRRKHELRVLAKAGIGHDAGDEIGELGVDEDVEMDDDVEMDEDGETEGSDDEFYKQAKLQKAAKLAAKAEKYSRTPSIPSLPETVDGKRQINRLIEKNRGLTRQRNKAKKNPRKNYKMKHDKAVQRRKGQVRDVKKPSGTYGGETTGINPCISRSTRF